MSAFISYLVNKLRLLLNGSVVNVFVLKLSFRKKLSDLAKYRTNLICRTKLSHWAKLTESSNQYRTKLSFWIKLS